MEFTKKQQKEIDQASKVLMEGEVVLDVTTGLGKVKRMGTESSRNGGLIVADKRVIFFTKKLGGYEMSDHVYGLLTSIDYKKGMMTGNINLAAAGDHYHISMVPKSMSRVLWNLGDDPG
jgi:Bacterial PH domain